MFVDDLFNKKTLTESNGGGSPWHSEPEQQQMDANRRGRLGRERNAGLDEPDDAASGSTPTGNGVYEYTVPAGQEDIAQELGLQQHRGHWVSRVPIQRANFQFGRPQFHEIPTQGVAEDDAGDVEQRMIAKIAKEKQRLAKLKQTDPEAYKREMAKSKTSSRIPPVSTFEDQGVAEGSDGTVSFREMIDVVDQHYPKYYAELSSSDISEKQFERAIVNAYKAIIKKQGVAEGSKGSIPPGSWAWQDGYKAGLKDTTNKKPVGAYAYVDGWKAAKRDLVKKQGVAEAATPASTSKVLRLIQRHHSDWFDTYGIGEVEDAVVDMAEMGQFQGMSAEDAVALVAQELDSLYGAQGMAEGSSFPGAFSNRDVESIRKLQRSNRDQSSTPTAPHQRSDWFDPASSVSTKKQKLAYLKSKKQQGTNEGLLDSPGESDSPVAQAIIRRILLQRTDLLSKYGPEKVGSAVDEVADFVGDVDEIGSSDVSGWIRHVEQMLGNMGEGVAEGSDKMDDIRIGDIVRAVVDGKRVQGEVIDIFPEYGEVELWLNGVNAFNPVTVDVQDTEVVSEQGVTESSDELYGLRVGDTVRATVRGKRVQGDVIDIFPDSMEVELLLRGANAGRTITVDVRDTEALSEAFGSTSVDIQPNAGAAVDGHQQAIDFYNQEVDRLAGQADPEFQEWIEAAEEKLVAAVRAGKPYTQLAKVLSAQQVKKFGGKTLGQTNYGGRFAGTEAAYYTPEIRDIIAGPVTNAGNEMTRRHELSLQLQTIRSGWRRMSPEDKQNLADQVGYSIEELEHFVKTGQHPDEADDLRESGTTISRLTDAKGRTSQQWLDLVNKSYPGARMSQEKGPWGKIYAELPDGRKLVWAPVKPDFMKTQMAESSPYNFIKPGAMVKFGMWNKPQEHQTGRVVSMANGIVKVTVDGGKTVDLHLGNKSLSIAPVSADQQGVAEGNNPVVKIKAPRAPSSPALAAPKAPAVAETIAKVERMLESVTSKKSAEMVKAYVDQKFTEMGLRNTTECRNLMTHVVQESAIRRRQYAKSLAK